jgi:hypothetical protein
MSDKRSLVTLVTLLALLSLQGCAAVKEFYDGCNVAYEDFSLTLDCKQAD